MLDRFEGEAIIERLTSEMETAERELEFEKAAVLRDTISSIQTKMNKPTKRRKKKTK